MSANLFHLFSFHSTEPFVPDTWLAFAPWDPAVHLPSKFLADANAQLAVFDASRLVLVPNLASCSPKWERPKTVALNPETGQYVRLKPQEGPGAGGGAGNSGGHQHQNRHAQRPNYGGHYQQQQNNYQQLRQAYIL